MCGCQKGKPSLFLKRNDEIWLFSLITHMHNKYTYAKQIELTFLQNQYDSRCCRSISNLNLFLAVNSAKIFPIRCACVCSAGPILRSVRHWEFAFYIRHYFPFFHTYIYSMLDWNVWTSASVVSAGGFVFRLSEMGIKLSQIFMPFLNGGKSSRCSPFIVYGYRFSTLWTSMKFLMLLRNAMPRSEWCCWPEFAAAVHNIMAMARDYGIKFLINWITL
jgi:hypothetical protein